MLFLIKTEAQIYYLKAKFIFNPSNINNIHFYRKKKIKNKGIIDNS
jgi:hypothetical protein